ncbi:hypothetical protein [Nocardia blacklockiae]|uniref:hypothetical protein n=1 Tax=Nocardia blacklockiae TaxID=480036 RepID=UPI0018934E33|nr:hypothetical protein [Nocardia blacklockiae]MBF6171124.1 hypothetical protein [Nocardia blacklockiae]
MPSRFSWKHLDRDEARQLWEELTQWVAWFRDRYQTASKITPCWYRHGAVVEELTGLMVAHQAVMMVEPGSEGLLTENVTAWHNQWMRSSLDAITKLLGDCTEQNCAHRPRPPKVDDAMNAAITADVNARQRTRTTS